MELNTTRLGELLFWILGDWDRIPHAAKSVPQLRVLRSKMGSAPVSYQITQGLPRQISEESELNYDLAGAKGRSDA